MRILYLPTEIMIPIFFISWYLFQELAARICHRIGDRHLSWDSSLFRTRKWEKNGALYSRLFKINKWKKLLPDGGAVRKGSMRKKHLDSFSKENLERFLTESCRAELTHWLAIIPFWVFGFIAPPEVIFYMFLYAIAVNAPCIMAQRYNRPRIAKLLEKLQDREIGQDREIDNRVDGQRDTVS